MSDLTYRLVVDMSTRGTMGASLSTMGAAGQKLEGSLARVKDSASSIASDLSGAFTGAVERVGQLAVGMAKVGAVAAGGAIAYGVTHLNNELEKTKISLASIFNAQGATPNMQAGLGLAGTVLRDMRKDAAALPGEFKDLLGFMRLGATPGLQLGANVQRLEKMSAMGMAAAASTGVQMDQAAREYAMLLQGRAGAHNVFGSMLGFTGEKAERFNKLQGTQRLAAIETELKKFEPSIAVFAESFDALGSTMVDNGKKVIGAMTQGLFERTKIALKDANTWFENHEESVIGFAETVGEKLNYAFDVGRRKVEEWWHPTMVFAANAKDAIVDVWTSVEPILERLGPKAKAALYDPGTIDHIRDILKLYGGVKLGSMAMPAFGNIGSFFGSVGGAGFGELAAAAGPVAALLIAAAGAVHILGDETNSLHETAMVSANGIRESLGNTFGHLKMTGERLEPAVTKVADVMGSVLLFSMEGSAFAIENFAGAINMVTMAIGKGISDIEADVNRMTGLSLRSLNSDSDQVKVTDRVFDYAPVKAMNALVGDVLDSSAKTKKGAGGGGGGTHIQKVEIVVSSNQDPSRIARLVEDRLKDVSRFPTSSPKTRNFSAARG